MEDSNIDRAKTTFKYGFSDLAQVQDWLDNNQNIVGLAFIGRSNVGKSSLINTLFGNKAARTSNTPGRTKEINVFTFEVRGQERELYLFDLPGYGFAKVSRKESAHWNELMGTFFNNIPENVHFVRIQDARHPQQKSDLAFDHYLDGIQNTSSLVFNKIDKLKTQKDRAKLNKLKPAIFKDYKKVKDIHFVSAEKRTATLELEIALLSTLLSYESD